MNIAQAADARFLRRILMGLVMLTMATGAIATYSTVSAMSPGGIEFCAATGLLCDP